MKKRYADWVYCCKVETFADLITYKSMVKKPTKTQEAFKRLKKRIYDFVEKWNAKQNIISYYPDYKRIVMLKD